MVVWCGWSPARQRGAWSAAARRHLRQPRVGVGLLPGISISHSRSDRALLVRQAGPDPAVANASPRVGGTGQRRWGPRQGGRSTAVRSVRANASHNRSGHNVSRRAHRPVARKTPPALRLRRMGALPAWPDYGCHRRMSALPLDLGRVPASSRSRASLRGRTGTPVAHTPVGGETRQRRGHASMAASAPWLHPVIHRDR